jgi:hypothetical protein
MCKSRTMEGLKSSIFWDITPCSTTMGGLSAETVASDGNFSPRFEYSTRIPAVPSKHYKICGTLRTPATDTSGLSPHFSNAFAPGHCITSFRISSLDSTRCQHFVNSNDKKEMLNMKLMQPVSHT